MNNLKRIEQRVAAILSGTRMTTRELAAAMGLQPAAMSQWLTRLLRERIVIKVDSVRIPGDGAPRIAPRYSLAPDYVATKTQDDTALKRVNLGPGHTRVIFGDRWRPGPDRMQSSPVNGLASSFEKI